MNIKLILNDNFDIFSKKEIVGNGIIIRKTISAGMGISRPIFIPTWPPLLQMVLLCETLATADMMASIFSVHQTSVDIFEPSFSSFLLWIYLSENNKDVLTKKKTELKDEMLPIYV